MKDMISVDISKIGPEDFEKLVHMTTLARLYKDDVIFSSPAFREIAGQAPYEAESITLPVDGEGKVRWEEARKAAQGTKNPVSMVLRDSGGNLEDIFYLPQAANGAVPQIKDVTYEMGILYSAWKGRKA